MSQVDESVAGGDSTTGSPEPGGGSDAPQPLLRRLNDRGLRLVQLADLLSLAGATLTVMLIRYGTAWPDTYTREHYIVSFAGFIGLAVAVLYFSGLYEREPRLGAPSSFPAALRSLFIAALLFTGVDQIGTGVLNRIRDLDVSRVLPMPTLILASLVLLGALVVAVNHRAVLAVRSRREGPPRLVLFGDHEETALADRHIAEEGEEALVVASVNDPGRLVQVVNEASATDVLVMSTKALDSIYPEPMHRLGAAGVTVLHRVAPRDTLLGLERMREVGGLPFVLLRRQAVRRSRRRLKRVTDVVATLLVLPVLLPALLLTGVWIRAVAGRPVLYRQQRVGLGGEPFTMVKFRTMREDAEADSGARLADREDDRVVRGAAWLRRSRLDELPQLWHVLRGEMSLVGPRPERPELAEVFSQTIAGYDRRHDLPPGITGLAQVQGRYHTDAEYKLGYDLQYLTNWSPILDFEILCRTVFVVLTGRT